MDKKGQGLVFESIIGVIALVIAIGLIVVWLADLSTTQCKGDDQCGEKAYCAVDKVCHTLTAIRQEVETIQVIRTNNYGIAGFIFGVSLVISALILRRKI